MTKDKLQKLIGQRIIDIRTKKGWSQAELARACGKDRQAIEKIENGKVNPTIYSLYEISRGLDVDVRELLVQMKKYRNNDVISVAAEE